MDEQRRHKVPAAARIAVALILAAGLAVSGYLAGRGVIQARLAERTVTVKGVAESEAEAALATMPLRFTVTGADLAAVKAELDRHTAIVTRFLTDFGFTAEEIGSGRIDVQDAASYGYQPEAVESASRYTLGMNLTVRSTAIERVAKLGDSVGELIPLGIAVGGSGGPFYVFTAAQLNEAKPALLRQAIAAANVAAEEFAAASGARLGPIRYANQGVISVLARDESPDASEWTSRQKRLRAVATVEYMLVD
jgi:hypothetical protein